MARAPTARADRVRVLAFAPRERARTLLRTSLRRTGHVHFARTAEEFAAGFRAALVDAAIVDVGATGDAPLRAAELARDFPSVAFLALTPFRPVDAPLIARCAELEFADVLADTVDDATLCHAVEHHGFSGRFAAALHDPPPPLGLASELQRGAWRAIIARAGRATRTSEPAAALGVTREHLSRSFSARGGHTLKRVIDLVRLLVAAELAKNPGYDDGDVARVLGYASSAHLARAARRLVGGASLASQRASDLIERFVRR